MLFQDKLSQILSPDSSGHYNSFIFDNIRNVFTPGNVSKGFQMCFLPQIGIYSGLHIFKCKSGMYISYQQVCDGKKNC